ncbi:hypothetical protein HY091_01100 [Candidatus Kaiserbacteria bacterium]|nr:hypothetical protein [Candidatus Kaiserbacteria bacterium]
MRIVLATPLYPPEIAEPAPYVKELARRLSKDHRVIIVAYGRLPERVLGVTIVAVDKRWPLPFRLLAYFFALLGAARNADLIYAQNGPSVELPAAFVALILGRPLIIRIGDQAAHEYATRHLARRIIERFALSRACEVISDGPLPRPEVIPFQPFPPAKRVAYEHAWEEHLRALETLFDHAH